MSGGVDSSVAALLLKRRDYKVVGVFMRCWNIDGCAERDAEDARRVAEKLKIPFYIWDFEKEYKKRVVDYMIDGYRRGITPNPDVMCNKEIKFGLFLNKALGMGADYVATGHYVRLATSDKKQETRNKKQGARKEKFLSHVAGHLSFFTATDKNKDQSYFLWTLTQVQLSRCLFPIGDYLKPEVRKIAKKAGLPTAEKKDSQGICFLGKVNIDDFLKEYIPEKKGDIMLGGKKIGNHKGAHFYTIGQRRLGIINYKLGTKGLHETKPVYVMEKNIKTNTLVVAKGNDNPALYKKEIELENVNFINPELRIKNKELRIPVLARVRYRQPLAPAQFIIHNSRFIIQFDQPVKFVASGQSAVFYLPAAAHRMKAGTGLEIFGGGVIK